MDHHCEAEGCVVTTDLRVVAMDYFTGDIDGKTYRLCSRHFALWEDAYILAKRVDARASQ